MQHHHPRLIALAVSLTILAGYIDALGFLTLGGFFASFMSGNTTRLAVSLSEGATFYAIIPAFIIFSFVSGVVSGSLIGHASGIARRHRVLCFVSLLLVAGAILQATPAACVGIFLMVMAMGATNAIFQRDGEIHIALTYMTGNLVRMGQRIANIFHGGPKHAWVPYACLWLGFIIGATIGALLYLKLGLENGLWLAALYSALLIPFAYRLRQQA